MRIHFVVPFLNPTGGIRVVFEQARQLRRRGHQVSISVPLLPYWFTDRPTQPRGLRRWLGDLRLNLRRQGRPGWCEPPCPIVMVPRIASCFLPPADAVIATAWPTAYDVSRLGPRQGTKLYYVQGFEVWSGPPERVAASYRLPLHKIVVSSELCRRIEDELGQSVLATVPNGVDTGQFFPDPGADRGRPRVLAQYSQVPVKGTADLLAAWAIVQQACPAARLSLFGVEPPPALPPEVAYHWAVPTAELRRLYSEADVFVSAARSEGWGMTPMEAMACGTAVVATKVGGIADYAIDGETALTVAPGDVAGLARAILRLLQDRAERERIAAAGHRHIQQFSWERATALLEAAIERSRALPYPVRASLKAPSIDG